MFASGKTAAVASAANYIEEVFSTYLYTGNGSTQTITNGIDLSTKGGLVWLKYRTDGGANHIWTDTVRGATKSLYSNATDAQANVTQHVTGFTTSGFSVGNNGNVNNSGGTFASWTFRKQPKFFDVVTWTGNGVNDRAISHALGSTPGCIIIKRTDSANDWYVYHRSLASNYWLLLNSSAAQANAGFTWTTVSSTSFTVPSGAGFNASGGSFVAYLFAHDAGGFGLTGTDNVISCGSATATVGTWTDVNVGFEPQWVLIKNSTATGSYNPSGSAGSQDWYVIDTMRGATAATGTNTSTVALSANSSIAEYNDVWFGLTSTGFSFKGVTGGSDNFIYIAIRRGPMKVPTTGTSVFAPTAFNSTGVRQTVGSLPVVDMFLSRRRAGTNNWGMSPRLTNLILSTNLTDPETNDVTGFGRDPLFDVQTGYTFISSGSGDGYIGEAFRRAPSFFDVVCYTGTGSNLTQTHNLTVVPELIIIKNRTNAWSWNVGFNFGVSSYNFLTLDNTDPATNNAYTSHYTAQPTTTQFFLGTNIRVNQSGATFVAYLFATCAGVSKCTAFTGTGTLQTINCGFTAGSRFVLIKRTDAAGDWYVWDSSRGLSSSTDPYLLLNSAAAEVTSTNWVDTTSTGFQVTAASGNNVNINGASYIALAIA